jgi:hypothetical protein
MADADPGPGPDPDLTPEDTDQYDDLPETGIETDVHVHFGMSGSFPLRLVDLFFASDGLHVVEYSYITPMFGLGAKKHRREAGAMQEVFDVHGIGEVLLQGDSVIWHRYEALDRVVLYDGGRFGRPKLIVYPESGPGQSHALRLHDVDDVSALEADLRDVAEKHGFEFVTESGYGFDPRENLQRFFS